MIWRVSSWRRHVGDEIAPGRLDAGEVCDVLDRAGQVAEEPCRLPPNRALGVVVSGSSGSAPASAR